MAEQRYYWLKLKRNFFNRHDIKILEAMPNGKEYVLFYLKLMCESIDHNGSLRFSRETPYTREMLAPLTNTKIEIVESAMEVLFELGMIECDNDKTYHIKGVESMIGSAADNDNAKRQQRFRDKQKTECVTNSNENKNKSKNKNIDIDNIYLVDFEAVWKLYPKKQGKENAKKSYLKARKEGVSQEDIIKGIEKYIAQIKRQKTETRYIKHGSTWFNQRCWEDEYDTSGRNNTIDGEDTRPYADQEDDDWFFNRK